MSRDFKIKTEVFEGPLDLLLSLIEKRKLLINDISLAKVSDDYIQYIKNQNTFSLKKTSHFILIASTLLLIKSKSLLPTLELSREEERDISDLETRLKIYKIIKESSIHIENRFGKNIAFEKRYKPNIEISFSPSKQISRDELLEKMKFLIRSLPKKELIPQAVVKKVMSLEEMILKLTKRIQSGLQTSFREFSGIGKEERVNVIIGFLAMLELVRQGIINVRQENKFEDIHMETKEIGTPNYS